MNVPNHEKKPFREMTAEERSAIVEAVMMGDGEYWSGECWCKHGLDSVFASSIYRTKQRQLIIPWELIKPEYKWAAMDSCRNVFFYEEKPSIASYKNKASDAPLHYGWTRVGMLSMSPLNIDTTGIDWRESLVRRPDGV